jgi:hypothetical protein
VNGRVESTGSIVHGVTKGPLNLRTTHCGITYLQLYPKRDETDAEIDCMACIAAPVVRQIFWDPRYFNFSDSEGRE